MTFEIPYSSTVEKCAKTCASTEISDPRNNKLNSKGFYRMVIILILVCTAENSTECSKTYSESSFGGQYILSSMI